MNAISDARQGGQLITIASGKGGVGKTWLAITLAHALARTGQRVLLFDGDLGLANIDIQLGLVPTCDLAGAMQAGMSLLDAAAPFEPGGFDIVAGRSGAVALTRLADDALGALVAALAAATARYDIVLIDLGAGIEPAQRRLAAAADLLLVVATDEPTSLTDAYAVLKLHAGDTRGATGAWAPQVVINQAASRAGGERSHATLARACTAFLGSAPALAGVVRRDEHVREAIRRQMPLLTRSPVCAAALDVEALAALIKQGRRAVPNLAKGVPLKTHVQKEAEPPRVSPRPR